MDTINLVMLILGLVGILFGFLYGRKRGFKKSLARLIIVALCILGAFIMRGTITEIVLETPVEEGKTIIELLTESLISGENGESMQGLVNVIVNILKMILQIFIFIVTFFVLRIVSMIVYWIVAAVISAKQRGKVREVIATDLEGFETERKLSRKQRRLLELVKEEQATSSEKSDKHENKLVKKTVKRERKKWWGSLVGLAQGALIVTFVVGPLNGLVANVSTLMQSLSSVEIDGSKLLKDDMVSTFEEMGLFTYTDSKLCKLYSVAGDRVYRSVSEVKGEDGKKVNIKSQIEAVDGGVKMVDAVSKLSKVDMENGFTDDVKNELVDIFNDLDAIKGDMSQESIEELDKLMKEALTPMLGEASSELPISLDQINFADVNFAKEGEVITSFYDLIEKTNSDEEINDDELIEEVVTTLSDSTLILPILSQMVEELPEEEKPNYSEEEKSQIEDIINNLTNQENADALKALFGIN